MEKRSERFLKLMFFSGVFFNTDFCRFVLNILRKEKNRVIKIERPLNYLGGQHCAGVSPRL